MATPQALAKILMAGGNLWRNSKKRSLCKAFREAAKEWCDAGPGNRPRFNDVFYQRLTNNAPNLAGQLRREVPVLLEAGAGAASQVGRGALVAVLGQYGTAIPAAVATIATAVGGAYPAGGITGTMGNAAGMGSIGYADAISNSARIAFNGANGAGQYGIRFLDGQFPDGQVLEIKGPTDGFAQRPGEAVDQCKVKGKRPQVVSCKSCQPAPCTVMPGGMSRCT